jgi:hypothetical protein
MRRVSDQSRDQDDRYTRSLEDQVEYLRRQLDQERDANRENRRIDAALTSRIPELEASVERGPQRRRRIARESRGPTRTHRRQRRSSAGRTAPAGAEVVA